MDKNNALNIEDQLCFPLYVCSREVIKRYKPFLDEIDLTYTQYIAMMVMWDKKTVTVKEMGEILYLDSGTLTPMLKKMEQKGLVTRHRSTEDERNLIVTITKAGEELREKAEDIPDKIAGCIDVTPEEAQTLYGILSKILGSSK